MSGERTYTLTEAALELAKRECADYGHSWDVIEQFGPGPTHIVCVRCGESYPVDNPKRKTL